MFSVIDGQAVMLDSARDADAHILAGHPVFASLVGAVYYGGVVASPFDRPLRCEALYDGRKAIGIGSPDGRRILEPAGTRAAYKLHVLGRSPGIDPARAVHDPVGTDIPRDARLIA